jgi:DNA repair exonuclease SbcCD ATPase subunit
VWRYLKSAFLVSVDVPNLGRVPVNALAATAFAILGFAQPAFWLLGLAIEAAVVPALAFNPRFQKVVEAQSLELSQEDAERKRQGLVKLLETGAQQRLWALAKKCNQVLDVYRSQQAEEYIIDSNDQALKNLEWVYLKLLVARHHLLNPTNETEATLEKKIQALENDLRDGEETESLRQSKMATLNILKKRLATMRKKQQTLEEIESDLTRIDNQVDLILENATVQGKPQTISADIELASDLLGGSVFGEDEYAISALEQTYGSQKPKAQKETA